jgi:hypothetical protein
MSTGDRQQFLFDVEVLAQEQADDLAEAYEAWLKDPDALQAHLERKRTEPGHVKEPVLTISEESKAKLRRLFGLK